MSARLILLAASILSASGQPFDRDVAHHLLAGTQSERIAELDYKKLCRCQCKDLTVYDQENRRSVMCTLCFFLFFKEIAGGGRTRGPLAFIYFLSFTTLPLSHSGSP
jgi:hypothetical protein